MCEYIGLDVSLKDTAISIRRDGRRVWRGKCASDPKTIAQLIRKHAPRAKRVVFETGSLSTWFYHALVAEGIPAVCIEARHAHKILKCAPAMNQLAYGPTGSLNHRPQISEHVQILREAGLRATPQRTAILAILAAADDHPSVDDVYAKARLLDDTVSVATVYRTMAALEDAGVIRKLTFDDAPARYEMMPHSDHDHLVDIDTGKLIEIPGKEIAHLRSKLAAELGYEIISQHTLIRGRRKV